MAEARPWAQSEALLQNSPRVEAPPEAETAFAPIKNRPVMTTTRELQGREATAVVGLVNSRLHTIYHKKAVK